MPLAGSSLSRPPFLLAFLVRKNSSARRPTELAGPIVLVGLAEATRLHLAHFGIVGGTKGENKLGGSMSCPCHAGPSVGVFILSRTGGG
jgi:hypothetical protein